MPLTSYQGSYNGLTFGPGSDVQYVSISGLRGLTTMRTGDVPKARDHGSWPGQDFMNERIITLTLAVFAPQAPFATVLANIANAFQPIQDPTQLLPLQFLDPGWATPRQLLARPIAGDFDIDTSGYAFNVLQNIPIQLSCPDPRLYDTIVQTVGPVGLPSPTAGLTFPVTFNVTFGSSTGGSMLLSNTGNFPTGPKFTIAGPMTNPTLLNEITGQFMTFNLPLAAGDVLVVDMRTHTAILNGTASRYNKIATGSAWFSIAPGNTTVQVGSSDSAAVAGTFTAEVRNAWSWG